MQYHVLQGMACHSPYCSVMIHCMHKSVNLNPVQTDVNFMAFYLLMEKLSFNCVDYGALSVDYLIINFHVNSTFTTCSR